MLIRFLINYILLIARNFVKLLIVRVNTMMDLFVRQLSTEKIQPASENTSSIIFIPIYTMAYNVCYQNLDIFRRILSLNKLPNVDSSITVLFSHLLQLSTIFNFLISGSGSDIRYQFSIGTQSKFRYDLFISPFHRPLLPTFITYSNLRFLYMILHKNKINPLLLRIHYG